MNKLLSCHYNMDTNWVEARFTDGSAVAIDGSAVRKSGFHPGSVHVVAAGKQFVHSETLSI